MTPNTIPTPSPTPLDTRLKVRFCNAYVRMSTHLLTCPRCRVYINHGDDDLCPTAKEILSLCLT